MVMVECRVMMEGSRIWIRWNSGENSDVTEFGELIPFGEWGRETSWIHYSGFWLKQLGGIMDGFIFWSREHKEYVFAVWRWFSYRHV